MATHQTEAEPQQPAAAAVEGVEAGQVASVADQADLCKIERKYLQNLKIYLNVNEEKCFKNIYPRAGSSWAPGPCR